MSSRMDRGQSGSQVSSWMPSNTSFTPISSQSVGSVVPHGLRLRHTILGCSISIISVGSGTITVTARNNFTAGDKISIWGCVPNTFNLTNVTVATASSTQFTITDSTTGSFYNTSQAHAFTYFQIPAGINFVYAIVVGPGGPGTSNGGGGGGAVVAGWTYASNVAIVGSGDTSLIGGVSSRYGHLNAIGGGGYAGTSFVIGGGGAVGGGGTTGVTFYGLAGAAGGNNTFPDGFPSGGGGGGGRLNTGAGPATGGNGGNAVSGGGGGSASGSTGTQTGGNGGSGLVGGGGGRATSTTGSRTGGNGGNGYGINGTIYTGGSGSAGTNANGAGGGGAGIAGNGSNASGTTGGQGGLGGGGGGSGVTVGQGGNGIIYIFY